jgi:hypothetical protein
MSSDLSRIVGFDRYTDNRGICGPESVAAAVGRRHAVLRRNGFHAADPVAGRGGRPARRPTVVCDDVLSTAWHASCETGMSICSRSRVSTPVVDKKLEQVRIVCPGPASTSSTADWSAVSDHLCYDGDPLRERRVEDRLSHIAVDGLLRTSSEERSGTSMGSLTGMIMSPHLVMSQVYRRLTLVQCKGRALAGLK